MKKLKKILSVLTLIVLVGSDILTSFSYAIEEIVDNTGIVQNEMGEVGENEGKTLNQSDDDLDEEVENNNEETYEEEKTGEETENMEILEEISQENEETLQGLSGENIDDENIDDEMENTEEEEKSEIEIARETLNENVIEKSEKYNDVVVNVSAKEGTFPGGTYVDIEAIRGNQLEEVRQQISDENNNILEESEIVAFDIKFLYELSDGTVLEVQPKNGESVKVSFDYSDNAELEIADKDETKEIQVYHINDKDESGEYVNRGEEKVEKIEINQEESKDIENGVVIDAENFSVYALVLIEGGNPTQYTLRLDSGSGTIITGDNIEVNENGIGTITSVDGDITLPLAIRENNEFLGWYTAGEIFAGSGGDSYEITGDITLYAKWEEDEGVMYTVTFDANRGTFDDTPDAQIVTGGDYAEEPQIHPELQGYTFTGWWTEPRDGTQWDFAKDVVTGNITLYAHWTYNEIFGELDVYMIDSNKNLTKKVMMDRNLGASARYDRLDFTNPNFSSLGFVYQWGNNWGFERCEGPDETQCHGTNTPNPFTTGQQISGREGYVPSKYASKIFHGSSSKTYNGATWIKDSDGNYGNDLWGLETGTPEARQGPCPDGYYLPSGDDYNTLYTKWKDIRGYSKLETDDQIRDFTEDFLFPLAGSHKKGRFYEYDKGLCADYWTNSLGGTDSTKANNFRFCRDKANKYSGVGYSNTQVSPRNNGSTVRCFKDSTNANLKIDAKGGKQALITIIKEGDVSTIDTIKEPTQKTADNIDLNFEGWYTTSDYQDGTKKVEGSTLSASDTTLYARWSCPDPNQVFDGISCVNPQIITFNANEGSFDVGGESQNIQTKSLVYGVTYNYSDLPTPTRPGHSFKGWYLEFDGVDDSVDYGTAFKFSDKISIHVSAYMENWSEFGDADNGNKIISCMSGNKGWEINSKNNNVGFGCADNGTRKSANSEVLWSSLEGGWHDFDVVFDGHNIKLYLDDEQIKQSDEYSHPITYSSNDSILLGVRPGFSNYFHGKIKDVIIQNSDQRITSTDVLLVPHQDVTYYALWEEVDGYTVTFDSMGGSDVPSQSVKSGTTGVRPSDPTKTGYVFSGWFLDGATEEFDFTGTQITDNITLYAHWNTGISEFTVNCYKKVLDVDHNVLENESYSYLTGIVITGATADEITVADYAYKCVTDAIKGYEYTGAVVYSSEDGSGTKKETATILPDGSMKIDMFFQPVQKRFTLNPATHTSTAGSSQNGLYYYGAKVTLSGDSNDDCYSWSGWNGLPEGFENSKQTYFYMPNSAVSVTPSVTQNTYNIIFSGNESSSGEMSRINEVRCTESIQLTPNAFGKTGYTFTGWSRTSGENTREYTNGQTVSGLSKINLDNVTLYAVWDINKYIVTGSVATGQENMGYLSGMGSTGISLIGLYDYATELVFIAIPELGYVFDYWKNGDTVLSGTDLGDGRNQLTVVVDQILDIIAFFKPAENTPYIVEHYKQNLDQTGYEFAWSGTMYGTTNELTNATGSDYEGFTLSGDLVNYQTGIKADGSTVVKLYYDRNVYTITWNNRNGSEITTTPAVYGNHPEFARDGWPQRYRADQEVEYLFIFTGWSRSGSSEIIRELTGLTTEIVTGDTTYIAQYDQIYRFFEVRYHPNGGTGNMGNQVLQLNTSGTLVPNLFTRTGYEFSGWLYSNVEEGIQNFYENGQEVNLGRMDGVDGDREGETLLYIDLYAQWKASSGTKVTVNYYLKDLDKENNVLIDSRTEYAIGVEFTGNTDDVVDILSRYGTGINGYEYSNSIVYGSDLDEYGIETGTTTILADGSRVIDMYYVPNIYQFTINSGLYSSTAGSSETSGYYYGANVRLSGDSNDDCFTWSGWITTGITLPDNAVKQTSFTMPANDVEIISSTTENTYNIIFNGNESSSGTMSPMNGVRCTESIGLTTNAFERNGYTFTGWSRDAGGPVEFTGGSDVHRLSTESGGNVTLFAIWDINRYTVTFDLSGGNLTGDMTYSKEYTVETPAISLENYIPVRNGYIFTGWYRDNNLVNNIAGGETGDYTLTAKWETDSHTPYYVEYYKENLGGTGYDVWTGIQYGTSDTQGVAEELTFTGFKYNPRDVRNVKTGNIDGDGSRVLVMYYTRNTNNVVYVYTGKVPSEKVAPDTTGYKYESEVMVAEAPSVSGYDFSWSTGVASFIMPDEEVTITGTWTANTGTKYTVRHMLQNLEDDYYTQTGEDQILSGETDELTNAQPNNYTGFELTGNIGEYQKNINGSGDTVVELKYDRKIYGVTTGEVEHGTVSGETGTQRYGKRIKFTAHAATGYRLKKWLKNGVEVLSGGVVWTGEELEIEVDTGMEIGAEFEAREDTPYYVEYYKENLDGGYDVWTGTYSGTTDQEATAEELSFTGFTYDSGNANNVTTGNIDGDGNRVLKLYYNREIYTITWLNEDGTDMDTTTVKYGEVPTHVAPIQPADAHYTYEFKGWDPEPTVATGGVSYRAIYNYIVNKYTITWRNDDGSLIDTTTVEYGVVPTHTNPRKADTEDYRYTFAGWTPEVVEVVGDAEYTASFTAEEKEKPSKGGNMSGGGGRKSNTDDSDNQHGSAEENSDGFTGDIATGDVDDETLSLYQWARENDITTMDTVEESNPDGLLTRGHMAKMVVNFVKNVLGKPVPTIYPDKCNWKDKESERESEEIKIYAKKACALGLMGIYVEEFMPNKILDRAEFGTIISRLLWGDRYNIVDTDNRFYYEDHLRALKKQGILMQIDNPEDRWEIRKWVWLVFRRISEKLKK